MAQTFIYAIINRHDNVVKIGFSSDPQKRLSQLQIGTVHPLEILMTFAADSTVEREIHNKLAKYRRSGEWFDNNPEVFTVFHNYMVKIHPNNSFEQLKDKALKEYIESEFKLRETIAVLSKELQLSNIRATNVINLLADLFTMTAKDSNVDLETFKKSSPEIIGNLSEMIVGILNQDTVVESLQNLNKPA